MGWRGCARDTARYRERLRNTEKGRKRESVQIGTRDTGSERERERERE